MAAVPNNSKKFSAGQLLDGCPAGISHPQVAMLARRLNGKYLAPKTEHLINRVEEINKGELEELIQDLMQKPLDTIKELYNTREIEK